MTPFRDPGRRGAVDAADASEGDGPPAGGQVQLRLPRRLVEEMRADLARPHSFAFERIGWLSVATANRDGAELLVLGLEYFPVLDEHYVGDDSVGARIGSDAIREAMQRTMDLGRGCFHVHLHSGGGLPVFSRTDRAEQPRLIESIRRVARDEAHGMLVLSDDAANAWVWTPRSTGPVVPRRVSIVGYPMRIFAPGEQPGTSRRPYSDDEPDGRLARQSFLGPSAATTLNDARIAVVGLGGGGSHLVQQLAHVGVGHMRLFDEDAVERSNLNRLVGAGFADAVARTPKTVVATRTVLAVTPTTEVLPTPRPWQGAPDRLRECDLVFGAVDSFAARRELEVLCRRYGIPYIDVGMDVHQVKGEPPRMGGQVILSLPEGPCMHCLGFLSEARLAEEAAHYGAAGPRPQVVWPNGVLASTAVGIAIDVLTGWTRRAPDTVYLSYDGNTGELRNHVRLRFLPQARCAHYPRGSMGDPRPRPLDAGQ